MNGKERKHSLLAPKLEQNPDKKKEECGQGKREMVKAERKKEWRMGKNEKKEKKKWKENQSPRGIKWSAIPLPCF